MEGQPRSGEGMQPTAQAVGGRREKIPLPIVNFRLDERRAGSAIVDRKLTIGNFLQRLAGPQEYSCGPSPLVHCELEN